MKFEKALLKETDKIFYGVYGLSNSKNSQEERKTFNICGLIHKVEPGKYYVIKVISLIDFNMISIHWYRPKFFKTEIKENMIVIFKNLHLKVRNNFEIFLDNLNDQYIKVLGMTNYSDSKKIKSFRKNPKMEISSLFSLVKPTIVRYIKKYLVTLKIIKYFWAEYIRDYNELKIFPGLKLCLVIIVDDGSLEAKAHLENHSVINLLNLDNKTIEVNKIL